MLKRTQPLFHPTIRSAGAATPRPPCICLVLHAKATCPCSNWTNRPLTKSSCLKGQQQQQQQPCFAKQQKPRHQAGASCFLKPTSYSWNACQQLVREPKKASAQRLEETKHTHRCPLIIHAQTVQLAHQQGKTSLVTGVHNNSKTAGFCRLLQTCMHPPTHHKMQLALHARDSPAGGSTAKPAPPRSRHCTGVRAV